MMIIVGTNRPNAFTKKVALYYQKRLEFRGIEAKILALEDLPADFASSALYENAGKNEAFNVFQKAIDKEEKFIFIVPEYNGSFPGVLKLFLDGLRYPDTFHHKKVALAGIAAGVQGNAVGLAHLSDILSYMGAHQLGLRLKMGQIKQYFDGENFTFEIYTKFVEQQLEQFIAF